MNIETYYKALITQCENLDYSNTEEIFDYALDVLYKFSPELCIIVMVNAIIKADRCLDETLPELAEIITSYDGNIGSYAYIKEKLVENTANPKFYHKDVLEKLLKYLESKYERMKVDLKKTTYPDSKQ
jgi:hypothetical protein